MNASKLVKRISNHINDFFKTISSIIMPFIPALIGVGLLKALLNILTIGGLLSLESGTYLLLYAVADGFFYFLPIICAFSAGVKFNANPYTCATVAAALVYPSIAMLYIAETPITFLGMPVTLMNYANGIFPAMVASYLVCIVEKVAKKIIPDIIHMFRPFLVILMVTPITFLVVGPIFTSISQILADGSSGMYEFSPMITGIIIGSLWQLVVILGLHYTFIPILVNNITSMGEDPLLALMGVTVFATSGAAIGFALKMKDKNKKADGISAGITGLLGITEPLLFSILVPYRKPFYAAIIGGGVGGAINAIMGGRMFGFGTGGITNIAFSLNPNGTLGTVLAFVISGAIAFFGSGIICFLVMKGDEKI